jgi:beta-galactosidase beta subunit
MIETELMDIKQDKRYFRLTDKGTFYERRNLLCKVSEGMFTLFFPDDLHRRVLK